MDVRNIDDITPMVFPSGRKTRVMIGQNGLLKGDQFCQGLVEILPGGSIPVHNHETVESYTILKGEGVLIVNGEERRVKKRDYAFFSPLLKHGLVNTGESVMHLMFVYAPQINVDHWAAEMDGTLK